MNVDVYIFLRFVVIF